MQVTWFELSKLAQKGRNGLKIAKTICTVPKINDRTALNMLKQP